MLRGGEAFFRTAPPRRADRADVREYFVFRRPHEPQFHTGLPKPYVELVFNLGDAFDWRATIDGPDVRFTRGWMTPLQQAPRHARPHGSYDLISARLYPEAAYSLFGPLPPGDGTAPASFDMLSLPWIDKTLSALHEARDDDTRFAILDHAIARAPRRARWPLRRLPRHLDSVSALAEALGQSPRGLHRHFTRCLGIAPKAWLRLTRLQRVIDVAGHVVTHETLAQVAIEHGLYDQAHLAREFRQFVRAKPEDYRRRRQGSADPPHFIAGG